MSTQPLAATSRWLVAPLLLAVSSSSYAIVGGGNAGGISPYPWIISLQDRSTSTHQCGGSLIAPQYILTSRQCLKDRSTSTLEALIGASKLNDTSKQRIRITNAFYPESSLTPPPDIAVLELAQPVSNTPMPLANSAAAKAVVPGTPLSILGWGQPGTGGNSVVNDLQQVSLPMVDPNTCKTNYLQPGTDGEIPPINIREDHLCAGAIGVAQGFCDKDIGSPLIYDNGGSLLQVGIASYSGGCSQQTRYSVYTQTQSYITWLDKFTSAITNLTGHSFGYVPIGRSLVHELKFSNISSKPVPVENASLSPQAVNNFSIIENQCEGVVINPGESCALKVRLVANNAGAQSAEINFATRLYTTVPETQSFELTAFAVSEAPSLASALQHSSASSEDTLEWFSGGNSVWFSDQDTVGSDGPSSVRSGQLGNSQNSIVSTIVTGPKRVYFRWKVSSGVNDVLRVYVDDLTKKNISQTVDWKDESVYVPAGDHAVSWVYSKDYSLANGADAAWIDAVYTRTASPDDTGDDVGGGDNGGGTPGSGGGNQQLGISGGGSLGAYSIALLVFTFAFLLRRKKLVVK